jgi:hypothetical protein
MRRDWWVGRGRVRLFFYLPPISGRSLRVRRAVLGKLHQFEPETELITDNVVRSRRFLTSMVPDLTGLARHHGGTFPEDQARTIIIDSARHCRRTALERCRYGAAGIEFELGVLLSSVHAGSCPPEISFALVRSGRVKMGRRRRLRRRLTERAGVLPVVYEVPDSAFNLLGLGLFSGGFSEDVP